MRQFKKASSFLSIVMVFSVVSTTFPIQVLAQSLDGTLPNTRVVPDYRASGGVGNFSDGSYFPSAPSFSARENDNFITSLPDKSFSFSVRDGVLDCSEVGGVSVDSQNNLLSLIAGYTTIPGDEHDETVALLCQPIGTPYPTAQNTTLAPGGRYGYGSVIQSYDTLPFVSLGEIAKTMSVEPIPNDPNNVRVTVNNVLTEEVYGLNYYRQGDFWFSTNLQNSSFADYIVWTSDWNGQTSMDVSCDSDSRSCSSVLVSVDNALPTPQITQFVAISSTASNYVDRPRNSDIVSITQPQCTYWSDGNFWRTVQHVYCLTYGMSADGRIGHADYWNSSSSAGWFQEFLGIASLFITLATGFGDFSLFTSAFLSVSPELVTAWTIGSATYQANSLISLVTMATVAAISGPTAVGTVEASNGLGVGTWTWSALPSFTPTSDVCSNGALDFPTCTPTSNTCPNGQTGTPPNCTTTVVPTTPSAQQLCTSEPNSCGATQLGYTEAGSSVCPVPAPPDNDTSYCPNPNITTGYINDNAGLPIITNAKSQTVGKGQSCTISWDASPATSCTVNGPGVSVSGIFGSVETPKMGVDTVGTSVYTITCYNGSSVYKTEKFTCRLNPEYQEVL
ncbi:MAG: hypothetical protein Q7S34_01220 [bacterium]|nr:hypothetical protein [bacterium]